MKYEIIRKTVTQERFFIEAFSVGDAIDATQDTAPLSIETRKSYEIVKESE